MKLPEQPCDRVDELEGRVEELREALRRLLALRDEQASGAYRPGSLGKRYKLAWEQAAELVGWNDGARE